MAKIMTRESLNKEVAQNPLARKYAKRIGLLEAARKVSGAAPMTEYQKYYAGQLFENIQTGNKYNLNEAYTQASDAGSFKRDVMNITSIAIQNTVLPELVSVQPMTSEYQALPILQFKYGTTKGRVTQGDVILDSTGAGYTDKDYDSKDITNMPAENLPVVAGTTKYLAPFTPIVPGSIKIVAGTTVITDDGEGKLNAGETNAGEVVYATGEITLDSAAAAGTTISFEYDNSVIPNYLYPEIDDHNRQQVGDVTISIQPIEMRAYEHKIRAFYGLTAGYRFNKELTKIPSSAM